MTPNRSILATAAVLTLVTALAGCATTNGDSGPEASLQNDGPGGTASSSPGAPVTVSLTIENATALFTDAGTLVTLDAEPGWAVDDFVAGVTLPEGVELVDGALHHEGAASPEAPVTLTATVRAPSAGEFVLRGWAEAPMGEASRAAPAVYLGVRGDADSASTFEPDVRAPEFDVTLDVIGKDAVITVTGAVGTTARLDLVLPAPQVAAEGATTWTLQLSPDSEESREVRLSFTENGTFQITAALYPDPAVDGRLHSDTVYVTVDGDDVTVSRTAPGGEEVDGEDPTPPGPDGDGGETEDGNTTETP